jgi:AbrB family looped-hinge helix DNA binding protein
MARTRLTSRGQTVIPAALRRRYGIVEGTQLEWIDTGAGLKVIPVPADPIAALRGSGRGERLTERLLAERARDRARA